MSLKSCLDAIKAFDPDVTDEQIEKILAATDDILEATKMLYPDDPNHLAEAVEEFVDTTAIAKAREKLHSLINRRILGAYGEFSKGFKNGYEALTSYLGGTLKNRKGGKLSIDAQMTALHNSTLGKFINSLEVDGLSGIFASGTMEDDIARELWQIHMDPTVAARNKEARLIAEHIDALQATMVQRLNDAGAAIRTLPGYIVRQSHDQWKISQAGKEEFIKFIRPLLDEQKTFGHISPVFWDEFLEQAYNHLASGNFHQTTGSSLSDDNSGLLGFVGPSNLAKKLSQHRVLHFKDADAWLAYNRRFGYANIRESILYFVNNAAKNITLMENLGPNPKAMFSYILQQTKDELRDTDMALYNKTKWDWPEKLYRTIDGSVNQGNTSVLARYTNGVLALQNASKLGTAMISSFGDLTQAASVLSNNGVSTLAAYGKMITGFFNGRGLSGSDRRQTALYLGAGLNAITGQVMSRFSSLDGVPGITAKLNQKIFQLNGMNWFNDTNQTSVAAMLSVNLGECANTPMDKLPDRLQKRLSQYDITSDEWDLMRAHAWKMEELDAMAISPDTVSLLSDEEIINLYDIPMDALSSHMQGVSLRRSRDYLEGKFATYFSDQINTAIAQPGAVERAMLNQGREKSDPFRNALDLLMQFKSFPLTIARKGPIGMAYGNGAETLMQALFTGKGSVIGLASYIAQAMVIGYVSNMVIDLVRGRTPADPTKAATILAALQRSGGLGLYADFLLAEQNKYGQSMIGTVLGPSFGTIDSLFSSYSNVIHGDVKGMTAAKALRVAAQMLPGQNLFYTRMAFEYMVMYRLNEMINPGYLRRLERGLKKEKGQQFFIPPSRFIGYGG